MHTERGRRPATRPTLGLRLPQGMTFSEKWISFKVPSSCANDEEGSQCALPAVVCA